MQRSDSNADDRENPENGEPAGSDGGQESDADLAAGHDLEAGILARAREWVDVIPWLRLGRTLRVAGSPPLLLMVALTFAIWSPVFESTLWVARVPIQNSKLDPSADSGQAGFSLRSTADSALRQVRSVIPTSVLGEVNPPSGFVARKSWWWTLVGMAWSLLIWMPTVLLLVRQGALLAAGRPLAGLRQGFILALRRTPVAWLVALIPLACVLALAPLIMLAGWMARFVDAVPWLEIPIALMVIVVAVPCGILAFGANFAVPLAWAAIANERDPDALDSLSRGYEYLLRRPLQLALDVFLSAVALAIICTLAAAVTGAATQISSILLEWVGTSPTLPGRVATIMGHFPLVVAMTLFWSLVGGVYLLLRQDAGGQEVEDLWFPMAKNSQPLPRRNGDL